MSSIGWRRWQKLKADPERHKACLEQKRRWREAIRLEDPERHHQMLLRKSRLRQARARVDALTYSI